MAAKKPLKQLKGLYKFYIACVIMVCVLAYSGLSNFTKKYRNSSGIKGNSWQVTAENKQNLKQNDVIGNSYRNGRTLLQDDADVEVRTSLVKFFILFILNFKTDSMSVQNVY